MVSTLSMVFMAISGCICFALPIVLLILLRVKKRADILPFFIGCAVMLVFALILESIVHQLVFASPVGETILGNTWLYGLYGGLMAALFEETGRFVAFRTVLRKKTDKDQNALMYGVGHGGFEAIAITGMTMMNNIIWSVLINTGGLSAITGALADDMKVQIEQTAQTLIATPGYQFLLGGFERISAMILQVALSVFVWFAAKKKDKRALFPLALGIHFLVDFLTVILSGAGISMLLLEAIIAAMAVLAGLLAYRVFKSNTTE